MDEINRMNLDEFVSEGYLQEVNRRFFHPLGLALEVVIDKESGEAICLGGIWDYRDDPEGILMQNPSRKKFEAVQKVWEEREPDRRRATGFMVQPVDKNYVMQDV